MHQTTCWESCPSTELPSYFFQKLVEHICEGPFLYLLPLIYASIHLPILRCIYLILLSNLYSFLYVENLIKAIIEALSLLFYLFLLNIVICLLSDLSPRELSVFVFCFVVVLDTCSFLHAFFSLSTHDSAQFQWSSQGFRSQ